MLSKLSSLVVLLILIAITLSGVGPSAPASARGVVLPGPLSDRTVDRQAVADQERASRLHAQDIYAGLPLSFEPNLGQTEPSAQFLSHGPGYTLLLAHGEARLLLRSASPSEVSDERPGPGRVHDADDDYTVSQLRLTLPGASLESRVSGVEELPGKVNYFTGSGPATWHTGIPTYAKVKYEQVYPGIDLVYYGYHGRLEYDFIVSPGADPGDIALAFEGADAVTLDEQGDLVLRAGTAEVRLKRPVMYQDRDGVRQEVPGGYASTGDGMFRFQVGDFDPELPLVIDPTVVYLARVDGDYIYIAVDPLGNVYTAGSADYPNPEGYYHYDVVVTKVNASATAVVFSTRLGGMYDDWVTDVAVDSAGNVSVAGYTESPDFPVQNAFQPHKVTDDAVDYGFVFKLDASGSAFVFSTYLGGGNSPWGAIPGMMVQCDSSTVSPRRLPGQLRLMASGTPTSPGKPLPLTSQLLLVLSIRPQASATMA